MQYGYDKALSEATKKIENTFDQLRDELKRSKELNISLKKDLDRCKEALLKVALSPWVKSFLEINSPEILEQVVNALRGQDK